MRPTVALVGLGLLAAACGPAGTPPGEPFEVALQADGLSRAQRAGREVFRTRCATCHGELGAGDGQNAYTLDPLPPDLREALPTREPEYWRRVVEGGTVAVERSALCPPWGRSLGPQAVDELLAYLGVLAHASEDAAPPG